MMTKRPRHITRRAPWMEVYTRIHRYGRGQYSLFLKIDNQQFLIGGALGGYTFEEVKWHRDMLCIALNKLRSASMLDAIRNASGAVLATMKDVPPGDGR